MLTVIVQSSSAMLGVTIALATVGLLDFQAAVALVLGENIGTTVTAQLAALKATADGRRAAMFHTLVNVIGVAIMIVVFRPWVTMIDALAPGVPDFIDASGERPFITAHIALAHTAFNVMMVMVALPLLRPLVGLANLIVREGTKRHTSLQFLDTGMIGSPALAIEQGRQELFQMARLTSEILSLTRQLYDDGATGQVDLRGKILKKEKITDTIQHEITVFMSRVMSGILTLAQSEEIRNLVRLADEIESVADYCERMANYQARLSREGMALSANAAEEIRSYLDETIAYYQEIIDRSARGETGWMPSIQAKGTRLAEKADRMRDRNLQRLAGQECQPQAGIIFNDILVAMRRIRNHSYNMAEAFLGQK